MDLLTITGDVAHVTVLKSGLAQPTGVEPGGGHALVHRARDRQGRVGGDPEVAARGPLLHAFQEIGRALDPFAYQLKRTPSLPFQA
ncbi:MAG: hypothetical protein WDN45_06010 [Caulobacteraceae bacterium]